MKKTITKEKVIEALEKENLRRNQFFHGHRKPGCAVCAVGAVLRKMSFEEWVRKISPEHFKHNLKELGIKSTRSRSVEEIDGELSSVPEPTTWTEQYEPPF